jgi:hypothetical protein
MSGVDADLRLVALLARAQLEALRRADRLLFSGASADLRRLVDLCGLAEALGLGSDENDRAG